jgi:hypothetical protein
VHITLPAMAERPKAPAGTELECVIDHYFSEIRSGRNVFADEEVHTPAQPESGQPGPKQCNH